MGITAAKIILTGKIRAGSKERLFPNEDRYLLKSSFRCQGILFDCIQCSLNCVAGRGRVTHISVLHCVETNISLFGHLWSVYTSV